LFQPSQYEQLSWRERLRTDAGRRAVGIGAALLLELLLLLLLYSLGQRSELAPPPPELISTFDASEPEAPPAPPEEKPAEPEKAAQPVTQPQPAEEPQPPAPVAAPPPPAIILPRDTGPKVDISQLPREPAKPAPSRPVMGPPAPQPGRNDTPIVGRRPNGQPIYAAAWYREPSHQEMAGYLSTADGPGWGLIECRTVPDFRVQDCEFVSESPAGSQIARAALAASWQFRVRPPRKGNSYLVGEWVRIRLELNMQRQ
jgi:protein TonB